VLDQPKTPSRSASRLDDRKDVLFDIHESDAAAAASWKSLFRSRCPTPTALSPTQHFDFGVEESSRSPMPLQSAVTPSSDAHRHRSMTLPEQVTTREEGQDGNVFRRSYSSRNTSYSARDLAVPSSPPSVAAEVQALTTDTHVSLKKPSTLTVTNFSMPRAQTAARETMEMESVTARVQMLEDDMLDLQGRMLELEQLIKEQRNTSAIPQPSRIVTNPKAYPSHTATSTVSSPLEHRSSQDDSTTSTWPRQSSSDVASIASSRSSTDDLMDSTITLQHPKHDPNQHHLSQAQPDYAASPKLYKMFIESKTDMDSLQSAITKLRADAASSLRLSGSNSAASSRRSTSKGSPSLGRAELVKHLLLASDGALLAAIASDASTLCSGSFGS